MSAIITNANRRVGLYAVRALGIEGIEATATEEKSCCRKPLAFLSKYCKNGVLTPSVKDEENYIKFMLKLSRDHDVLIPCLTDTMEPISKHLSEFEKYINVPILKYEHLNKALDKALTLKIAMENDIPCPHTFFPRNIEDIKNIPKDMYPLVIKFRRRHASGVAYAYTPSELITKYKVMHRIEPFPLIQEYIPGTGVGFFALFNKDSKERAVFAHKRIREYPITGGISAYCESIKDHNLQRYGLKLLKSMNWYGIAMVEFRLDNRDNLPKLMEVNPRFWGSMSLAIHAGVNFPYLLYKLAVDGDIKPVYSYKVGIKTRFLFIDLLACIQSFKNNSNKIRTIYHVFQPFFDKQSKYGVLSLDDPKPSVQYIIDRIQEQLRKITERKKIS